MLNFMENLRHEPLTASAKFAAVSLYTRHCNVNIFSDEKLELTRQLCMISQAVTTVHWHRQAFQLNI